MDFDPDLSTGQIINNSEMCDSFKCSPQGGMRRSKITNTLVIVSNHVEFINDDHWDENGVFQYTGIGTEGDKCLSFMQNKTLS